MNRILIFAVIGTLALSLPAHAGGCGTVTTIGSGEAGSTSLYLDDRSDGGGDIHHRLYLESNGVDGLQTGQLPWCKCEPVGFFLPADFCYTAGPEGADTLIL